MSVILFAGESYYAKGGFNDFQGVFIDEDSAMLIVDANAVGSMYHAWDWWHMIDSVNLDVVARSDYQAHGCDEDCYTGELAYERHY